MEYTVFFLPVYILYLVYLHDTTFLFVVTYWAIPTAYAAKDTQCNLP